MREGRWRSRARAATRESEPGRPHDRLFMDVCPITARPCEAGAVIQYGAVRLVLPRGTMPLGGLHSPGWMRVARSIAAWACGAACGGGFGRNPGRGMAAECVKVRSEARAAWRGKAPTSRRKSLRRAMRAERSLLRRLVLRRGGPARALDSVSCENGPKVGRKVRGKVGVE